MCPIYATQKINPRISSNHDKVKRLLANNEILIKGIDPLL